MIDKKTLFPKRMKQLREAAGLKQEAVAQMLHYGSTAISNYESGRNEPCFADLISIADFFDVSVDYLLANDATKMQKFNFQIEFEQIMNGATPKQQLVLMDTLLSYKQILNKHKIK